MRINKADLERLLLKLNTLTNSPTEFMTDGKMNVGHYYLDWAYGGVQLQRLTSTGGSCYTVINGYGTKRKLYESMLTYISGVTANKS